jgi:hypothetical protein
MVKKFREENPACGKGSELAGRKIFRALQRAQRLDGDRDAERASAAPSLGGKKHLRFYKTKMPG